MKLPCSFYPCHISKTPCIETTPPSHHFLMWVPIESLAIVFSPHPCRIISLHPLLFPLVLSVGNQQAWPVAPSRGASKAADGSDAYRKRPSMPGACCEAGATADDARTAGVEEQFCSRSSLGYMLGCVAAKKETKKLETYTPAKQRRSKQLSGIIVSLVAGGVHGDVRMARLAASPLAGTW